MQENGKLNASTKFIEQVVSALAWERERYSDSALERAMVDYFLEHQETKLVPR